MKLFRYTLLLVTTVLLFNSVVSAQMSKSTPSIADVAKRERQRQKDAKTTTELTRDSITESRAASPAAPPTPAPAASSAAAPTTDADKQTTEAKPATTGPTDNKGRDEKWWRAAFQKVRQEMLRSEDKLKVLQLRENDLTARIRRESIATRANEEQAELDKVYEEKAVAKHEYDAAQQRLADLEEELRRSGGLPGWAR